MRRSFCFVAAVVFLFLHGVALAGPVALVEDVAGTSAARAFDYLAEGQVLDLGASGTMSVGYLGSCVHEEIKGGRVTIGSKESTVKNGKVTRVKVPCDGGRLVLAANQAVQSGATAVRDIELKGEPKVVVYDTSPLIFLPKSGRVVIKRVDMPGERHALETADGADPKPRLDLAAANIMLVPGGTYMVSVGGMAQVFRVATEATSGNVPMLSRIVPF